MGVGSCHTASQSQHSASRLYLSGTHCVLLHVAWTISRPLDLHGGVHGSVVLKDHTQTTTAALPSMQLQVSQQPRQTDSVSVVLFIWSMDSVLLAAYAR